MKTTTAIALFISALFVGGTAMAQGEQDPVGGGQPQSQAGGKGGDFTKLDANQDGRISKSEASADSKLKSEFDKLDSNKDGQLSAEEYGKAGGVKEKSK